MQTLFSMTQQELEFLIANPNVEQLRYKIELSDEEAVQLSLSLISAMRSREHEWLQYRNGIIDRGILDTLHSPIRSILSSVNGRKFWQTIGQVEFDGEFTAYVNQMLEGEPIDKKSKFIEIYIGK